MAVADRGRRNTLTDMWSKVDVRAEEQVTEIRARYSAGGPTNRGLALEYGVSKSQMANITSGKHWAVMNKSKPAAPKKK